jgi:hypothetical protein
MAPSAAADALADAAYAHACAVLGDGSPLALEAATLGLRRGGRSLSAVLGHTRAAALERADGEGVADGAQVDPDGDDLADLARQLTFTRPAVERAVVDLDTRYGLDRAALGRALGLPPAVGAARAAEVMLAWQESLDPAVFARMGTGDCAELAALLDEPVDGGDEPSDPRGLLATGGIVAAHAAECAACRDRLRAMVSVRTLLAQSSVPAPPPGLREAAALARLRPSSPPPPLDGATGDAVRAPSHAKRWGVAVAAVVVAFTLALVGGVWTQARHNGDAARVEALTKVPAAGTTLEVTPTLIETALPPSLVLRNLSQRETAWSATSDRDWIVVTPSRGRLDGGALSSVTVAVSDEAPEGELRAAVTFVATDGSTAVARLHTTISHPPDVASTVNGCEVTAAVEDESEVSAVALHWREAATTTTGAAGRLVERSVPMSSTATGYHGSLPSAAAGHPWWVTATDALGNTARTAEQVLPPGPC